MNIPAELRYTRSHEWARLDADGSITIGISDHAQQMLGDIVFVEMPAAGRHLEAGKECAVIESVKAAADIYAPVSGEVIEANAALADTPQSINADAYGAWLFKLRPDEPGKLEALLDAKAYAGHVESEEH